MPKRPRLPRAAEPLSAEASAVCAAAATGGVDVSAGRPLAMGEAAVGAQCWPGCCVRTVADTGCVVRSGRRSRFRPEGSGGERPVTERPDCREGGGVCGPPRGHRFWSCGLFQAVPGHQEALLPRGRQLQRGGPERIWRVWLASRVRGGRAPA